MIPLGGQAGTTRAEGPRGAHVRGAKRNRIDHHARMILPLSPRYGGKGKAATPGEAATWENNHGFSLDDRVGKIVVADRPVSN